MAQRQQKGGGVDGQSGQIFAQDHFQAGGRQRQQEFIRSLLFFFRPHSHGQGRNKENQQIGEDPVELVQIGQILQEKTILPEGCGGTQKNEKGDKNVPGWVREVFPKISLDQCLNKSEIYSAQHDSSLLTNRRWVLPWFDGRPAGRNWSSYRRALPASHFPGAPGVCRRKSAFLHSRTRLGRQRRPPPAECGWR